MTFAVTDVLGIIQGPDRPPDQWRVLQPFDRLRQTGIETRTVNAGEPMPYTDPDSTILVVSRQTSTDLAAVDRWISEHRQKVKAIVYDLDDILWGPAMLDHLTLANFKQGQTDARLLAEGEGVLRFLRQCDGVTTASEPLAALVRTLVDCPVICVPNAIDVREFRARMAHRPAWADHLTIGWSGGRRPERDVEPMAEAWGRIARRYPHVRFVVAAPVIPDVIYQHVDDEKIIRLPWLSWREYPTAYQVDIGCCAVADTEFSRAKTPIKCWEYAVAGAAAVGTRALYGQCTLWGGYTPVTTADEWDAQLSYLIDHKALRRGSNEALRYHVNDAHSLDTQLSRWPEAWSAIVESRKAVAA